MDAKMIGFSEKRKINTIFNENHTKNYKRTQNYDYV